MTQQTELIPLTKDQIIILNHALGQVRKNTHSLFEIIFASMILYGCGYVTLDDYAFKVAMSNERQTFINLVEESLQQNKVESWH